MEIGRTVRVLADLELGGLLGVGEHSERENGGATPLGWRLSDPPALDYPGFARPCRSMITTQGRGWEQEAELEFKHRSRYT